MRVRYHTNPEEDRYYRSLMDHYQPTPRMKRYLDAEGKYHGQTPCKCHSCKKRRRREHAQK